MNQLEQLKERSSNTCEFCKSTEKLSVYLVPPQGSSFGNEGLMACDVCMHQIEKKKEINSSHWNCLRESMWSEFPAVQVVSWRMLQRLKNETWAADLLEQLYMDDDQLAWAMASGDHLDEATNEVHKDSNGAVLRSGDSVTLIKSLDVKGSQVNAKIGTVVKNIKLVENNTDQIEGKIEGQQIVILTKFVRKSS